ncbi:unnamed protein product [Rotaria sp. Silwood2]|nr:unnamed protein product [Rotaria sp. Silwood2]CAF4322164.1 unnamed protein product [Rotaria sp. Silwood2]
MPTRSKRRSHSQVASTHRWSNTKISDPDDSSGDEYSMEIDDQELTFNEKLSLTNIGDLAEMCKSKCDIKHISTLLYMSLRYFNIKWEDADEFLKNIGFTTAKTSHKWATVFIKGDYQEFSSDLRGGKQTDSFYDTFPEIEADARAFVVQACSQKSADFKAADLTQSGAVSIKQWFFKENIPFFSKGRGRSHMVSDFLVQHPSGPLFELSEDQWQRAVAKYKSLSADNDVNYLSRTATAKFGKTIGTRCPVEQIEYVDENGAKKVIDCYFKQGPYKDQSKGLAELAKELGVQLPPKAKLDEIRKLLSEHRAF